MERKNKRIELQRLEGDCVYHCIQVSGSGYYFTTEREIYAYCEGRGFIKRDENPYYKLNFGIYFDNDYYKIIEEEHIRKFSTISGKKAILYKSKFQVNSDLFFDLFNCKLRGKNTYYETLQEVYAYLQGKQYYIDYNPFTYPDSKNKPSSEIS